MKDIRIVHDQCGAYADWEREKGDDPSPMRNHRYLLGHNKPNYPLPAIRTLVEIFPDRVVLWYGQYPAVTEGCYVMDYKYLA